jgi:hypothetical protein
VLAERNPKAVSVVAAFLFAASVVAVVVGASLLFPNPLLDRLWELNRPAAAAFRTAGKPVGALLWMLGAGAFAVARGLLRRCIWAWWFALILFAVNGAGDLVTFLITGDWLRSVSGIAVCAVFVSLLCRRDVRRTFGSYW